MPRKLQKKSSPRSAGGDRRRDLDTNWQRAGSMSQPTFGFPDQMIVDLPYADHRQVTSGTAYSEYIYNLNSAFDPDRTGTGHQPRYWDRYTAVYNRYRVLEALVEIEARQRATHGAAFNAVADNSSTSLVGESYPSELPRATYMGITSSNQPPVHAKIRISPWAVTGRPKEEYMADDTYAALTTASPSEVICLHVLSQALDNTTAADVEFHIRITYRVQFFDRLQEGPSLALRATMRGAAEEAEDARRRAAAPSPVGSSGEELVLVRRPRGHFEASSAAGAARRV